MVVIILLLASVFSQGIALQCPKGIQKFSHRANSNRYYDCTNSTEAVLSTCPQTMSYIANKEGCYTKGMSNSRLQVKRRATAAQGYLGDVYNIHHNQVEIGSSLWKKETIEVKKLISPTPSLAVNVFISKVKSDRLERSGLSAALNTDIAGGMARLEGSCRYLQDPVKSDQEAVVVLTYDFTTSTSTLPTHTPINSDCPSSEVESPTHVVSGITYGAAVNFLFKKDVGGNESVPRVARDLMKAVQHIQIDGAMSSAASEATDHVRVDLFSDIMFAKKTNNFLEAAALYRSLPDLISKYPNISVPYVLQLTPIEEYCPNIKTKLVPVSPNILYELRKMFAEMEKNKLMLRSVQARDVVASFPPIHDILSALKEHLDSFELSMKMEVQTYLPLIRRGNGSETLLVELLNKYHASPFDNHNLKRFLLNRKREVQRLEFALEPSRLEKSGVKMVDYDEASEMEIIFTTPYALMLRWNILPGKELVEKFLQGQTIDETRSWYRSPSTVALLGHSLTQFTGFATTNYQLKNHAFIFGITDLKDHRKLIDTVFQRNGMLYNDVDVPDTPDVPPVIFLTHESATILVPRIPDSWLTGVKVSFWEHGKTETSKSKSRRFSVGNTTAVVLDELIPGSRYSFSIQFTTLMGLSQPSSNSTFTTRGCGPPVNVVIVNIDSNSVELSWDEPVTCGEDVKIRGYNISITGSDHFQRSFIVEDTKAVIRELMDSSCYKVVISTLFNKSRGFTPSSSLPSSSVKVVTMPAPVQHLSLIYRTVHSAMVSWTGCRRLAPGGKLIGYRIRYSLTNGVANRTLKGSQICVMSNNTSYLLTDLLQGTTYKVSVQVVTTIGSSQYAPNLVITTVFQKSELDKLREKVEEEMKVGDDILRRSLESMERNLTKELHMSSKVVKAINTTLLKSIEKTKKELENKSADIKSDLVKSITGVRTDLQKEADSLTISLHDLWKNYEGSVRGALSVIPIARKGWPASQEQIKCKQHVPSAIECILYCKAIRDAQGHEWDIVEHDYKGDPSNPHCCCYKNSKGWTDSDDSFSFKFV